VELLKFPDIVDSTVEDLFLNQLCKYLYDVASQFNGPFYQKCPTLGAKEQNSRLLLCELTRKVLEQGFALLGFRGLEQI